LACGAGVDRLCCGGHGRPPLCPPERRFALKARRAGLTGRTNDNTAFRSSDSGFRGPPAGKKALDVRPTALKGPAGISTHRRVVDHDRSLAAPGKGCRRPSAQMEPSMCELAHVATDFIRRSNAAKHILDRSLGAAAVEGVMAIA
jgi:hypothetical protein